jgi:alkanesulfonate monooxygenase SsuD/methylene tetrahydromethanopterin reductase-like flavin-dependent oxidoreductase (luciferase family)
MQPANHNNGDVIMEFGVFILGQQRSYAQTSQSVIHNTIEQTMVAEQAGFNAAWYAEHHFNNYSLSPSPLMTIAHAAAKTKKIRLGSAVCILPLYHPARLLAEIGLADTLSEGRLELGIGSGYQQFEFERFGCNLANSGEIFHEMWDMINHGLGQKVFEHKSKHFEIPPTSVAIRTVQEKVPLWITSMNPGTLGRAFKENVNLFTTVLHGGTDALRGLRGRLEGLATELGKDLSTTRIGFLRCGFASDNESEIRSYLDSARWARRISESLKDRRMDMDDGYLVKETPCAADMTLDQLRANLPVGSINEVIDKLLQEIDILKPNHIALQTQLGDCDQKMMLRQIELWGDKIIPAVRKELARNEIAVVA